MTTIRPEADAARIQGAAAAHAGEPRAACPHPAGGWLALNWLVGHALALGQREASDVFREGAKKALKRERRAQAREARAVVRGPVERPPRPSKPCARPGCRGGVTWKSGRSRAEFDKSLYCSSKCRAASPGAVKVSTRGSRTCALDGCTKVLGRKQTRYCCWDHYRADGGVAEHAAAARAAAAAARRARSLKRHVDPAPETEASPSPERPPVAPRPIPPAVWHAARDGMSRDAMRRLFGLDDEQAARVMALQRRGGSVTA
jgi:hypothetical protein